MGVFFFEDDFLGADLDEAADVMDVGAASAEGLFLVFLGTVGKIGFDSISGTHPICKQIFAKRLRRAQLFAYGAAVRVFVFRRLLPGVFRGRVQGRVVNPSGEPRE